MIPRWSWSARGLAAILLAQSLAGCDHAAEPHRPDSPVVDKADILPPSSETTLDTRLRRFWNDTGNAVVVVSVNSLDGQTIEQYAFDLFNSWHIGSKTDNRGILVLVAPNERKVRIEVGCGLESILTDKIAATVISDQMLPHFRENDMAGGTLAGADALMGRLADIREAGSPVTPICKENQKEAA